MSVHLKCTHASRRTCKLEILVHRHVHKKKRTMCCPDVDAVEQHLFSVRYACRTCVHLYARKLMCDSHIRCSIDPVSGARVIVSGRHSDAALGRCTEHKCRQTMKKKLASPLRQCVEISVGHFITSSDVRAPASATHTLTGC